MTKILPIIATATLGLSLAACGSNEEAADETIGTEYDAEAPSLEEVASDAEMEALEAQEEAIEEEAEAADPNAIDTSDINRDNAETEEIVGL